MVTVEQAQSIAKSYRAGNVHIGVLGSHSALELGMAAKSFGARTLIVVQEDRADLYTRNHAHLYDHVVKVKNFKDILNPVVQEELLGHNTIWVPHRSFTVYVGEDGIEREFGIPIYGNRRMLRTEDRNAEKNQYYFLAQAGIRFPKQFKTPKEINAPVIVKVQRADKPLERGYFIVSTEQEYFREVERRKGAGILDDEVLGKARMEEYVIGSRANANFHAYALEDLFGGLDFVGFSDRRQTNLQGFLQLPAVDQPKLGDLPVTNEEVGHYGITTRESLHPLVWKAGEAFVRAVGQEYPPGMIGSFGLQGAWAYSPVDGKTLEFVVFDVSPRIPGDPAIGPTSPEMRNLSLKLKGLLEDVYGGRRIEDPLDLTVLEILEAARLNRLSEVVT